MSPHVSGATRATPLRVGFDGRALASPAAGVRRYSIELIKALLALDEPLEMVMLGGRQTASAPPGLTWIPEPPHPPTNAGWMIVGLPVAAHRARVDLVHAPAYTAPFWCPVPVALTIHDVSYARRPEWFPYRRDALRRIFYRMSATRSAAILTDSRFSAEEIRAAYRIAPERITVVPLGVDASFTPDATVGALPAGVTAPFVLHVGDLHERRNLPLLARAVLAARATVPSLTLVLAGVDRGIAHGLRALAAEAQAPDAVLPLGPVGDASLRALYRSALVLAYPSRYEGFGLPVLEALACGTPVIASRAASIPEVVGEAGILLDPLDAEAWREALVRLAGDVQLRASLSAAGPARAAQFSWGHTARQTLAVYRSLVDRR